MCFLVSAGSRTSLLLPMMARVDKVYGLPSRSVISPPASWMSKDPAATSQEFCRHKENKAQMGKEKKGFGSIPRHCHLPTMFWKETRLTPISYLTPDEIQNCKLILTYIVIIYQVLQVIIRPASLCYYNRSSIHSNNKRSTTNR